jgi:uncharacterized membrane protein YhaH (DUF805 family)
MDQPALWSRVSWLVTFQGRVAQRPYVVAGGILIAVKVAIDWLLCVHVLDRPWTPWLYWGLPPLAELQGLTRGYYAAGAVSVLFAWFGVALTVRRLRDAGIPVACTALFVLPALNLVLLATAACVPTRVVGLAPAPVEPPHAEPPPAGVSMWGWAIASAVVAWLLVVVGVWLQVYGAVVFLGVPYLQGFLVGLGTRALPRSSAAGVVGLSVALLAAGLLAFALEGMLCLAMATPIWLAMAMIGLALGRALSGLGRMPMAVSLVVVPLLQVGEPALLPSAGVFEVATEVVVQAPPAAVWRHLIEFSELPPPTELPFRLGIAHPLRASIEGHGVGAVRRCTFTTGDFVEPIEVWDEPRLLRFRVEQCPQPMVEWNPLHDHVDAPHLHGTFVSHRGQFALTPRPDGGTSLVGTTWYSHGMWPETYWALWSDAILHVIHRRVLDHIRNSAEAEQRRR